MTKSDSEPIRGKVARILNARELALNVGAQAGVKTGMRFYVLDPRGENIMDPDTGEDLGSLGHPKITVEVSHVEPRVSVARTFRTRRVNRGGDASFALTNLGRLLQPADWVTVTETLRAKDSKWEELDESESFVKVGDPVVQVTDFEDEAATAG